MSFCGNHDINFTLSLKEILDVSVKSNFNQSRTIFFSSTDTIECVRSCDQKPYLHNKTKGGICIKIEFTPQKNISVLQHGRRFFVYSSNMAAVTSSEHTLFFSFVNFLGQMPILISSLILVCPSSMLAFIHFPFSFFGSNFNFMSFCIYFSLSLSSLHLPPLGQLSSKHSAAFQRVPIELQNTLVLFSLTCYL